MKPQQQSGAALIVVLGIVAISTMIGLASMQSSQIDEKMAGNYRAAALAQMAAEAEASSRITLLDESSSREECRGPMANQDPEELEDPEDSGWHLAGCLSEEDKDIHQRAYYMACELKGQPGYAIIGEAIGPADGVLARHRIVVAGTGGGGPDFDPPSELSDFSILTGGAMVIYGQDHVDGEKKSNNGLASTPVPSTEYIDAVKSYMGDGANYSLGCATRGSYVFCDSQKGFDGDLTVTDADSEKIFVVDGGATTIKLETKQDIHASFVASGSMVFNGASKTQLTGMIWVGGALMMNGTGNFVMNGSIVVGGSATFNGGLDLTGSDQTDMLSGGSGITWQEF